jgi:hypothetical protein
VFKVYLVYDKFENILTHVKDHEDKLHFQPSPEIFDNGGNILQQSFVFQNMRDHNVIHIADSVQWHPCPLDQPIIFCHEFHDPIADWMESLFSKASHTDSLGMVFLCCCEYELSKNFLLHTLNSFYVFSDNCKHKAMPRNQLLDWLFWKFVYT